MKKDIVLVGTYYEDNGWYGERYRVILSQTSGVGFTSVTAAKKFTAKLRKYIKTQLNMEITNDAVSCNERQEYLDTQYQYISAGPSVYYDHNDIDIKILMKAIS